jgi:hypothetical protein
MLSPGNAETTRYAMRGVAVAERRHTTTIRFPGELLAKAKDVRAPNESLNDLVVESVEREVRRRQGLQAYYEDIVRLREKIEAQRGVQSDSRSLIRALRDGEG